jgi:hypothetical protein
MSIVEFAIEEQGEEAAFIRPVWAPGNPYTYGGEQAAREALTALNGNGDDDETYRVVKRTVSDWTPAKADGPMDVCTCGHTRSEHSAPVGGVCIVTAEENIGDDGHDTYADECMAFVSAS